MRAHLKATLAACALACLGESAIAADTYQPSYYYYYPGSGYVPAPGPRGALAQAPLDVVDSAPSAVEGGMASGDVIGQHVLRAADARILLVPVMGRRQMIPAGVALAKVQTSDGKGPDVWCDIRAFAGEGKRAEHDCLADSRNVGSFDQLWLGESPGYFLGLGVNVVRSPKTLPIRVAYRSARPEERPTGRVGYRLCGGDDVTSPPRFAPAVTATGDSVWTTDTARGCALGHWPDAADRTVIDVDGLRLHVDQTSAPGRLTFRFTNPAAPMGPIAMRAVGLGQAPAPDPAEAASSAGASDQPLHALVASGAPPAAVGGSMAKGTSFFTVGVRHGVTGVLKNEVQSHTWLSDRKLPFDQPLYGVPMAGSAGPGIVWCAPQAKSDSTKTRRWEAACLVDGGTAYVWVAARPALMVADLHWTAGGGRVATPPSVERRPVDLPPMTLSYAFGGWNKQRWAVVQVQIDWGEGPQTLRSISIPPGPDGAAAVRIMGAEIHLRPGAASKASGAVDQAEVEVLTPPSPGSDITF